MKKIGLLVAALLVSSMSFADGGDYAKINLVKKLYKTDAQGYAVGATYSEYAAPEFKKTIRQASRIIDRINERTGELACDYFEHYDMGLGNGDTEIRKLKIVPSSGNIVQVSFSDGSRMNNLKYDISCAGGRCLINDIVNNGESVRKQYQRIVSKKRCD